MMNEQIECPWCQELWRKIQQSWGLGRTEGKRAAIYIEWPEKVF